jgi:hypothetical protein
MVRKYVVVMLGVIVAGWSVLGVAAKDPPAPTSRSLPPIETFVLEPVDSEGISIWVPAGRSGPIINRACATTKGHLYACLLPAGVTHTKSDQCPEAAARLAAEYVAPRHAEHLPLTIVDGWRWEYLYSLSRYESASYDLPARGGSWDYALEAILTLSEATVLPQWLQVGEAPCQISQSDAQKMSSTIKVFGFSIVRPRHGYPKTQQF